MNRCQYIKTTPVYAKSIGEIAICPSEFVHPDGAHIMDQTEECKYVADPGDKYCPRHKAIAESEAKKGRYDESDPRGLELSNQVTISQGSNSGASGLVWPEAGEAKKQEPSA